MWNRKVERTDQVKLIDEMNEAELLLLRADVDGIVQVGNRRRVLAKMGYVNRTDLERDHDYMPGDIDGLEYILARYTVPGAGAPVRKFYRVFDDRVVGKEASVDSQEAAKQRRRLREIYDNKKVEESILLTNPPQKK